jgi:hypothetical protein
MCSRLSADKHDQRSLLLDLENKTIRDITQSILDDTISDNELVKFREIYKGGGTNQDQTKLIASAVKAAARSLGSDADNSTRYRLAWRIVRLHNVLQRRQGVDFCPSILAKALRDPRMRPRQRGMSVPCRFHFPPL